MRFVQVENSYITHFITLDSSVLLENTPLIKFLRNHIRDLSGLFSISSLVRISMLSLISSLSLKLYLNSLVYDRNIFGSSSKLFGLNTYYYGEKKTAKPIILLN